VFQDEPYLAEIRLVSFNFPPKGWAFCDGQLLSINQNQALFSLLGTTYGGNGQTTFSLPDLRGRAPVHAGDGVLLGEKAGEDAHTLTMTELPNHTHTVYASSDQATSSTPAGNVLSAKARRGRNAYAPPPLTALEAQTLNASTIGTDGGGQPHENTQPSLVLNFIIALQGIFPSRN
jgi:microcystin-dependent protein